MGHWWPTGSVVYHCMGGGAAPLHIATYTLTASLRAEQRPKGRGGAKVRGAKNTQSRNADATLNAKTNLFAEKFAKTRKCVQM